MLTRPCKLQDPKKVQEIVDAYFSEREAQQEVRELKNGDKRVYRTPPSIYALSKKLGITRDAFYDYTSGKNDDNEAYNKEIIRILLDARERIIDELKEGVMLGYWNDRVTAAMLVKYGEIGPAEDTKEVKIVMQCKEAWSE